MSGKAKKIILLFSAIFVIFITLLILAPRYNYQTNIETTITVKDSVANTNQLEATLDVKRAGTYLISCSFWKGEKQNYEAPGFINGVVIEDEKGSIVKSLSAGALDIDFTPTSLKKGKYTLKIFILTNQQAVNEFSQKHLLNTPIPLPEDTFKDGTWEMHYNYSIRQYQAYFIIACIVGGIIIAILLILPILDFARNDKDPFKRYDERQIAMQGKAYKYAFFSMLSYFVVIMLISFLMDLPLFIQIPFSTDFMLLFGLLIGVVVFAVTAIINDAYFSLNENRKFLIGIFSVLTVINLTIGIILIARGELVEDLEFNLSNSGNLISGIALLILLISLLVKRFKDRKED